MTKLVALAGSARKDSFNRKLLAIAVDEAKKAGAEVDLIEMDDFPLPPYHGDDEAEQGLPENAKKIKKRFIAADGFLFASPEYNSSVSGSFKNLLDWVSRPEPSDSEYLTAYKGKTAAIMSASPGGLGGIRGLVHLRDILGNIGVHVHPDQVSVPGADKGIDPKKEEAVRKLTRDLVHFTQLICK